MLQRNTEKTSDNSFSDILKKITPDIVLWIIIILWSIMIFSFSAENSDASGGRSEKVCMFLAETFSSEYKQADSGEKAEIIENMQFFVRKTAHFTIYAVLGGLVCLALRRIRADLRFVLSTLITALYAVTDEMHQLFIDGRSGQISDVLLDTCGGATGAGAGILLMVVIVRIQRRAVSSTPVK